MGVEVGGSAILSQFYCIFKGWYSTELSFQNINMFKHLRNQRTGEIIVHSALPQTNNIAYVASLYNKIMSNVNP